MSDDAIKVYLKQVMSKAGKPYIRSSNPVEIAGQKYWLDIFQNENKDEDWKADYYGYIRPAEDKPPESQPTQQEAPQVESPF